MNSFKQEHKKCGQGSRGPVDVPEADMTTPDANVGSDGQCITPPHPESVREDTGEPCDDGRDGGPQL